MTYSMSRGRFGAVMVALSCAVLSACGEDEPDFIAPDQRCDKQALALVAEGVLEQRDGAMGEVTLEAKSAGSSVRGIQAWLKLNGYDSGDGERPLLVRVYGGGAGSLLTRIERAAVGGPLSLTVVDTSAIPAGNVSATALDRYDCNMEQGKICVQVGEDSNNNGILDDNDVRVFNATGGTMTIQPIDFTNRRLRIAYDVALSRNITDVRSMSAGSLAGCLDAFFQSEGESDWKLD